jgi:hypothetical protein
VEILDGVGPGDRVVSTADVEVGEPVRDRGEPTP